MRIAPGERIRIRVINAGSLSHADSPARHELQARRHRRQSRPGGGAAAKDTVLVGPAERVDLEVEGTNPGVWMFHCHMPNHQDNGMMTAMVYDGFAVPSHIGH